jgi:putative DNA primase/helicase
MKGDVNDTLRSNGAAGVRARHDQAPRYKPRHGLNDPNRAKGPETKCNPPKSKCELESVVASEIKMRAVEWLWPFRFAIGKLGLIGGLPDKGKGLICSSIIASATANVPLPCGEGTMPQGNVIWLTAEDDIEDTIIPRLHAAGANRDRVHIIKMLREQNGKRRMFSLVTDLDALCRKIEQVGDVVLIIIDPMSAYIGTGKVNSHMTADVRGFLAPLVNLAAEKRVAMIGIMHFNKKNDVTDAMLRIADSLAYVAAARHVYVVVDDAEVENRRLFVKAKNNLSHDNKALSYFTSAKMVGTDEKTGKEIWAPYVVWGTDHVKVTAAEAMKADARGSGGAPAKREAREFLLDRLEAGPIKADDLLEEAEQNGISLKTLRRAKQELQIISRKEKKLPDGGWLWELPPKPKSTLCTN